ncbi:Na+/H+ antiporter NhaC family protein [Oceanobacillus jeddahense]|uniref:Na+/H+ antiporter NhaC family protein n=1 Tax=Oceanobacillus jeddahense TaxID=1462527 RepID=UPI000595B663|nr:Na+/H+ antiporter NhaC family protein [Oceanobacillus jeddahense]
MKKLSVLQAITLFLIAAVILFSGLIIIKASTIVVLIFAGMAAIIISIIWGIAWKEIEKKVLETATRLLIPSFLLLSVGILIGSWMLSGTIPLIMYYGLTFLNPTIFLFVACIICALMSILTGTSWGTIGTIGVAIMGVALGFGIPMHYAAAAVVVGALFGDKMSPLSDTTIAVSAFTNVNIIEHIRYMLYTTIPGLIISLILYLILGFQSHGQANTMEIDVIISTLNSNFNLNPILLLPPIIVLVLIFMRKPALPVFGIGILLGSILAMVFQGSNLLDIANTWNEGYVGTTGVEVVDEMLTQGGLTSMYGTVGIFLAAALFGGTMIASGAFDILLQKIIEIANTGKKMMLSCLSLHTLFHFMVGSNHTSSAVLGPMLSPLYNKFGLHRKNLSRAIEDTGAVFQPLIPWSTTSVFILSTLNISTSEFVLYGPLIYLGVVFAIIYILTGFRIAKANPEKE